MYNYPPKVGVLIPVTATIVCDDMYEERCCKKIDTSSRKLE